MTLASGAVPMLCVAFSELLARASGGTLGAETSARVAVPTESADTAKSVTQLLLEPLLSALARRGRGGGAPPDRLGRGLDAVLDLAVGVWRTLAGAAHALGLTHEFEARAQRHSNLSIAAVAALSLGAAVLIGLRFGALFSRGRPPAGWPVTARPVNKDGLKQGNGPMKVTAADADPPKRPTSPIRRRKPHGIHVGDQFPTSP